jgi:hypothetical protein
LLKLIHILKQALRSMSDNPSYAAGRTARNPAFGTNILGRTSNRDRGEGEASR